MPISMHSNDGNFYVKKLIGKCKSNILMYKGIYSRATQSLHVIGGENNVAFSELHLEAYKLENQLNWVLSQVFGHLHSQ